VQTPQKESEMAIIDEASALHSVMPQSAVLDEAHIGDIKGAFGTIRRDHHGPRRHAECFMVFKTEGSTQNL
jgi:hypothetical protein